MNYKLVNFVELCSEAFMKLVDYNYEKKNCCLNDKIYVAFNRSEYKQILRDCINGWIDNNIEYGSKLIIFNSCDVSKNWRNSAGLFGEKYLIVDKDCITTGKYELVHNIFESLFDKLELTSRLIPLKLKGIDYLDGAKLLEDVVGSDHIEHLPHNFITIQDGNYGFVRTDSDTIPDNLISYVENKCFELEIF